MLEPRELDAIDAEVAALIDQAVVAGQGRAAADRGRAADRRLRPLLIRRLSHGTQDHLPRGDQRGAGQEMARDPTRHRDGRGRRRRRRRARRATRPGAACSASPRACTPSSARARARHADLRVAFIGAAAGAAHGRPAAGGRADVRRLRRRVHGPDLQPGREVPLHVRRQGGDAGGDPHHAAPACAPPRSTRSASTRSSPTCRASRSWCPSTPTTPRGC